MRIAFLGLGAMGVRMARHLAHRHDVVVWNRSPGRDAPGARTAPTPAAAAEGCELVLSMLTDDQACAQVWLTSGTGAVHGLAPGALAIECSTVTPGWIARLHHHVRDAGASLLDAPVAGSLPQADASQLLVLAGGRAADVERAAPALACFSARTLHAGPSGQGAVLKLAVNALFAIQVAAVAEVQALLATQGADVAAAWNLVASGPVASPAAKGIGALMLAGDHAPRFPVDLVAKDLAYAVDAGAGPLTAAARDRFRATSAQGHGRDNLTAVRLLDSACS